MKARDLLQSGKAEAKLREIIAAQGGNPNIKPQDIQVGPEHAEFRAPQKGRVLWINTDGIVHVARAAGAPKEKGAGIFLHAKLGDEVAKEEVLFEIYAERSSNLSAALELANRLEPIGLSKKTEGRMLLGEYPAKGGQEEPFILER
jgi:AMP phosphorylase